MNTHRIIEVYEDEYLADQQELTILRMENRRLICELDLNRLAIVNLTREPDAIHIWTATGPTTPLNLGGTND